MSFTQDVTKHPLSWPVGQQRTKPDDRDYGSRFGQGWSVPNTFNDLLLEMDRLGASEYLVSTNVKRGKLGAPLGDQKNPQDPGVAVWFKRRGKDYVLACDKFYYVHHNLRALVLIIESLRRLERYGTEGILEQAFYGFQDNMLPVAVEETWWQVLGLDPEHCTFDDVTATFKQMAKENHPDLGGSDWQMSRINVAYAKAKEHFRVAS